MKRLALLTLFAACTAPARAPVNNTASTTRLALQPIQLMGLEGRHSASHTSSALTGTLELVGDRATLALDWDHSVSHVHCNQAVQTVQQCADPTARDTRSQARQTLTGTAKQQGPTLTIELKAKDERVTLACNESGLGYSCTFGDAALFRDTMYPPKRLVFARPSAQLRYELRQTELPDSLGAVQVKGELSVAEANATVALAVNGRAPRTFALPLYRTGGGVVMKADGVSLVCPDGDSEAKLDCDLTADPGIFGRPSFWGRISFAQR